MLLDSRDVDNDSARIVDLRERERSCIVATHPASRTLIKRPMTESGQVARERHLISGDDRRPQAGAGACRAVVADADRSSCQRHPKIDPLPALGFRHGATSHVPPTHHSIFPAII